MDSLTGTPLCVADIRLAEAAPLALGRSPWSNRRISDIAGGTVTGERLSGEVLPGGADWSELGIADDGTALTLIDVRSVWRTTAGGLVYVTYKGRLVIPADVLPDFRDPARVEALDPARYHFRTLVTFETAAPDARWLNAVVAVGLGRRTARGVRYTLFTVD